MTTTTQASAIPKLTKNEAMALASTEYDLFTTLLHSLSGADWQSPTVCTKWNVRQVALHVLGAAEGNASVREMVHQQLAGTKLFKQRGYDHLVHGVNDIQVTERQDLTAAELITRWDRIVPKALAGRRNFPPFLRGLKVDFVPPLGKRSMAYVMDLVYTRDVWMHRIDVSRALGREPVLTAEHDGRLIADMVLDWATTHGHAFDLELTGPAGGHFAQGDNGQTLRIDAIEWIWINSGRGQGSGLLTYALPL
ncbi:maleylpyruvate isomerase family mycothiol-dependent enzyme [Tenggerimyces flavus]|uniref:Maleylpyruvate isomerase family mycothiol-dependent enzyme n=1 Tax=Tenggerimyces flavus TaxID=1708749 RepID=A0ABV7YPL9_9ACTN|nr:maleylpyruvate isomerase family mycothiol-dependent enzyme [Tenggerimyces flavus]MBM7784624.1 uncharacterized protein (TIGR03083 family) [Tenggerimyces flavus]